MSVLGQKTTPAEVAPMSAKGHKLTSARQGCDFRQVLSVLIGART